MRSTWLEIRKQELAVVATGAASVLAMTAVPAPAVIAPAVKAKPTRKPGEPSEAVLRARGPESDQDIQKKMASVLALLKEVRRTPTHPWMVAQPQGGSHTRNSWSSWIGKEWLSYASNSEAYGQRSWRSRGSRPLDRRRPCVAIRCWWKPT
jgi:hypothetical protein